MNIWRSPLVKTLVVVLSLTLCGAFWAKSRPRQSHTNIVGKWHAISNPHWVKNHFYEFFADGRYTDKFSSLQMGGVYPDDYQYWYDENYSGRYELSPDNVLTIGTESAAWNGGHPKSVDTNAATSADEEALGSYSSFKLRINGAHIIANFQEAGQAPESWYRMRTAISIQKPHVGRDKNKKHFKH